MHIPIASSQSGCIDNNHGGDYIYTVIISGTEYDGNSAKVPHTYNSTTDCNAVILPSSPYSSCTITKNGMLYGTGSLVNYSLENCPLDDYSIFSLCLLGGAGYYLIKRKHLILC
ncbi:hypothetical protein CA265_01840 [Sphingobacteriaceae bacterium GW460-11-11-14-LB5]|nr:hypothetical protein CA265_01840 [Sphingobacteriaceae bacterium GW460-11-11-14-LB5]